MTIEKLKPQADSIVISSNPKSGSSDRQSLVRETARRLEEQGYQVQVHTDLDRVVKAVDILNASGRLRTVVAAGGDGTVSLLANLLGADVPLAILPLGTENLLAKYLKLSPKPKELAELIVAGQAVRLDAGQANGKLFLVMTGCGFDAEVVHRLHAKRTGHIRHMSYAGPILRSIGRYRFPALRIEVDGELVDRRNSWAFVFNVPRYAMNLKFVDDADSQDGQLDLITFRKPNLLNGLFYLVTILFRNHRGRKDVYVRRFKKARITSEQPVHFQLDGDPGGSLPLEIEVVPKRLRVLVGQEWIERYGQPCRES
jgi:YegS/Rv2252/BmrU family lipid kinase